MSFFAKVKQFFGAGTVKVELTVPPSVDKSGLLLTGSIKLKALSDQHVLTLSVLLEEEWKTGRKEQEEVKTFELGKAVLLEAFDMKAGEEKVVDFELPFTVINSNADDLKKMGGAIGMLGKAAAFANAEKSRYRVKAEADVKGAAFDPTDEKEILLT